MPAHEALSGSQFEQLQLFMTGKELKSAITMSYDATMHDSSGMEDFWKRKLRESKRTGSGHGHGIYQSIREKGWASDDPNYGHVNLTHETKRGAIPAFDRQEKSVDDAHHRIAAAAHIEGLKSGRKEHFIPVTHWESFRSG